MKNRLRQTKTLTQSLDVPHIPRHGRAGDLLFPKPFQACSGHLFSGYRSSLSGLRRTERGVNLSPPSAEVTNEWSYTFAPQARLHGTDRDNFMNSICIIIGKGKAVPVQAQIGSRSLRLPEFLDNQHMNVARLSAVYTGRLYPQGRFQVLIPVKRVRRPQGHSVTERIKSVKTLEDPIGNRTPRISGL